MSLRASRERRKSNSGEVKEGGYTLVEAMVMALIVAILIAIAVPTYLGARKRAQDRATCDENPNGERCLKSKGQQPVEDRFKTINVNGLRCVFDTHKDEVQACVQPTTTSTYLR